MTHLVDAVGQLLRQQTMRIHFLPGAPDAFYKVRAPSLLAQLGDAVASSTTGRGGRTTPGSRVPLAVDALQMWTDIHTAVHAWAKELHVDRRPYLRLTRAAAYSTDVGPAWMRTLRPWLRPVAWDQPIEDATRSNATTDHTVVSPSPAYKSQPTAQPPHLAVLLPLESSGQLDPALPPIGRLLRVTAAAAISAGSAGEAIAITMARRSYCGRDITPADCTRGCWTHRIVGLLAGAVEDREIRGAACWECRTAHEQVDPETGDVTVVMLPTTTYLEDRSLDGSGRSEDLYRVPAIVVRIANLPDAGPDDLWVYRMCRACGAEGWLDYTTDSAGVSLDPRPISAP